MKVKLKGIRSHGKMQISGIGKLGVRIPPYFEVEIGTDTIKERKLE